jgi:hypothetical protein
VAQQFIPPIGPAFSGSEPSRAEPDPSPLVAEPSLAPAAASQSDDWINFQPLPFGLLWEPPIANQREPRCYVKLTELNGQPTTDTAIGAVFSLARIGPANRPDEGFQIDVMAAVFSRIDQDQTLMAMDYRVGCPLTFAADDWQFKLGYEHTSTHTGDVAMADWVATRATTGDGPPVDKIVRDEIVLGIARRMWDQVRAYGQVGYSFADHNSLPVDWRYDCGIEWTPPVLRPRLGGPYAAVDMDLRHEQDYYPGVTIQTGWEWQVGRAIRHGSSAARLAAEYYHGKSPFGLFSQSLESWWGVTVSYDW